MGAYVGELDVFVFEMGSLVCGIKTASDRKELLLIVTNLRNILVLKLITLYTSLILAPLLLPLLPSLLLNKLHKLSYITRSNFKLIFQFFIVYNIALNYYVDFIISVLYAPDAIVYGGSSRGGAFVFELF